LHFRGIIPSGFLARNNILAQVDTHIGTHAEAASSSRLSVSTPNTTARSHEETKRSYVQWKSLKCLPLEKLESALAVWYKQAHESNA
jgi:hypothetical protein